MKDVTNSWAVEEGPSRRGRCGWFGVGRLVRGSLGDEVAAFGEDDGVVLDDLDGVAFVHEAMEDVDEALYISHVEADGGFFDEVEVAFGVLEAAQFGKWAKW